ncbi:MAG: TonB-dependent receptor plug domain-containing protein, partial [Myxococcales bacterium]|nr:TonB-dependent receptor plug domain-containing protein [Myxococcales bacterium]
MRASSQILTRVFGLSVLATASVAYLHFSAAAYGQENVEPSASQSVPNETVVFEALETTTVDSVSLHDADWFTLSEILAEEAGVDLTRRSQSSTGVTVGGLGSRHVGVLLDGIPLNSPVLGDEPDSLLSLLDPQALSMATIAYAGQSPRYLSGSVSGALLLNTREVPLGPLEAGRSPGRGDLLATFTSADLGMVLSPRAEFLSEDWGYSGGGRIRLNDQMRTGDGSDVESEFAQVDIDQRLAFRTGGGRLDLTYLGSHQSPAHSERDDPDCALDIVSIGHTWEVDNSDLRSVDLRAAYVRRQEQELDGTWRVHRAVVDGHLSAALSDRLHFRLGLNWEGDFLQLEATDQSGQMDFEDRVLADGSRFHSTGLGAELAVLVGDSGLFSVVARAAYILASVPDPLLETQYQGASADGNATYRHRHGEHWQTTVQISSATRVPNLLDLAGAERTDTQTFLPNDGLTNEQGVSALLAEGFRHEHFELTLSGAVERIFDVIVIRPTGEFDPDNLGNAGQPLPYVRAENLGRLQLFGLRVDSAVTLGDVRADFRLGYQWVDDLDSGSLHTGFSPLSGFAAVTYDDDTLRV